MNICCNGNIIVKFVNRRDESDYPFTPGLYHLFDGAGAGKTRLYKLLNQYSMIDNTVKAYTYYDIKMLTRRDLTLEQVLSGLDSKVKIIIFDRLDLYYEMLYPIIDELGKRYMVLFDLKSARNWGAEIIHVRMDTHNKMTVLI